MYKVGTNMVQDVIHAVKEASRAYLEDSSKNRLAKMIELSQSGLTLFGKESIDFLNWPETEQGQYAKRFLFPLVKNGIQKYIKNCHADIYVLKVDHHVLPIVVAHEAEENSYVCSPFSHYFGNFTRLTHLIDVPLIAPLLRKLVNRIGVLCNSGGINSVVYVNNWLFSTDLYPKGLTTKQILLIVKLLNEKFSAHAIVFRSLNSLTNTPLLQTLKECAFKLIASRQVYLTDATQEAIFKTRIVKSDLKLWRETSYQLTIEESLSKEDRSAFLKLYNALYIDQHTYLNPQFTESYINHLVDQQLLNFIVLRSQGVVKGIAGYLECDGVMFCPLFGYDKTQEEHQQIYRLLNTSLLIEAKSKGLIFHQSSGASFYKKVRRAKDYIETKAIYTDHLPFKQRAVWSCFRGIVNLFAPRFMKKY